MATEYKLPFTAKEIEEKLGKVGEPVSYNELNDRPFGEEVISLGDTLTWDGKTANVVAFESKFDVDGNKYVIRDCLVSDNVPTIEELKTGTAVYAGSEHNLDEYWTEYDGVYEFANIDHRIWLVLIDGATIGNIVFPKKGIYFRCWEVNGQLSSISSLRIPDYNFTKTEVTKVDPKYLPECIGYEEVTEQQVTIEYDGDPTGKTVVTVSFGEDSITLIKVSDLTPSQDELIGATAIVAGTSMSITAEDIYDMRLEGVNGVAVGEVLLIAYSSIELFNITEPGMYIIDIGVPASLTYNAIISTIHKIDPKFLPDGGVGYAGTDEYILTETVLSASADFMYNYFVSVLIEPGRTYEVIVDNESITREAKETTITSGSSTYKVYYVGNESLAGDNGVDTGENFAFVNIIGVQEFGGLTLSFIRHRDKKWPDTLDVSIKRCGEIHKIDPKYLPEGIGYESYIATGGDTLVVSGTPAIIATNTNGITYGLVSSTIPTYEQLLESTFTYYDGTTCKSILLGDDGDASIGIIESWNNDFCSIMVVFEDGVDGFPQKGIYFLWLNQWYVTSFTLPGYGQFPLANIHKIDEKYLPDGTGTKIIDLTKYTADDGNSFNTAILLLFTSGGGSLDVPCTTTFWDDVNTTKPIKLKLDASALVSGATIYSDATAIVCQDYGASFFSTTYAMYEPNSHAHIRTTVMFERYTDKIRISLVLEPLTIPN